MSDLFKGQTMTEMYTFVSAGAAHTFSFGFQPDKVVFNNITASAGGAGGVGLFPRITWYRGQTTTAHAFQEVVVDTAAGASYNFLEAAANGFTVADTAGGSTAYRALIAGVSQANPCVVTTTAAHGFTTGMIVRITDLGSDMPVARGMEQITNKRFKIIVLAVNTFSLLDVETGVDINSTAYTAWVAGGRVDVETRTQLYSDAFTYDPITYRLTAGTAVMGANTNVYSIEVYKFGSVTDLGSL
jgi:hypothetical protein